MQNYKPMLAKTFRAPFSHEDWLFEVKWDGFRAIAYLNYGFSLTSRNGNELRQNFPEISELKQLASNVVLDGELVVMKNGRPDFQSMQIRGKATKKLDIEKGMKDMPATYVVFDILEKDGKSLLNLPLVERKKILKDTVAEGKHVCLADYIDKSGEEYFKIAVSNGLEGLWLREKTASMRRESEASRG